ncbi:hypothetical protein AQS8620_01386 [Aquimixticola soesokkakensis]|uniref:Uncharacterized protein n=1 Tax=Aquimixticola soesokkakensis TaxID=1519096 RepID=A0A1Y5SCD7_9RHOB|nr:hypothetical protein [Aquimixticola soesokkakensis]SLN37592.1 hypothetical protein AQS8620_01386 [Aquimixticola soesokkakensis]
MLRLMLNKFRGLASDEEGAVTVDFIVITSAVVGMGVAVLAQIADGGMTYGTRLNQSIAEMDFSGGMTGSGGGESSGSSSGLQSNVD